MKRVVDGLRAWFGFMEGVEDAFKLIQAQESGREFLYEEGWHATAKSGDTEIVVQI